MKKIAIILLSLAYAWGAYGQKKWTLRECIDYALENNLEIEQQRLSVEGSEIDLNTSRNSRLPDLSASAGQWFGFGRSPSLATGIYENASSSGTSYSLSAGMTIFQGGRINNEIKGGRLNLEAAREGLGRAMDDLSLNVALRYMDVLFKKEVVSLADDKVSLTAQQLARTEVMVEEQSVPRSQLYDMQAQLANDELAAVNARNELAASLLDLAQTLNLSGTDGFEIVDPDDSFTGVGEDIRTPEEIFETATAIKPRVREAELRLRASETGVKAAQAARWPSVTLGASHDNGFNHSLDGGFSNPAIKTQLKNNRRQSVGLSVNIPLFGRNQTRNAIRTARLSAEGRRVELEQVKSALFKEIEQAYQGAVSARARYAATEKARNAAAEAYRHAAARYDEAMSTAFELNESLNKLIASRSELLQAKYEFLFRMKILDFYRGIEL